MSIARCQEVGMLDAASQTHFQRHGWVHVPRFLSDAETRDLVGWTDEIASWPETPGKWMRYYERGAGEKMLARIENFVPYHDGLARLLTTGRMLDLLSIC